MKQIEACTADFDAACAGAITESVRVPRRRSCYSAELAALYEEKVPLHQCIEELDTVLASKRAEVEAAVARHRALVAEVEQLRQRFAASEPPHRGDDR